MLVKLHATGDLPSLNTQIFKMPVLLPCNVCVSRLFVPQAKDTLFDTESLLNCLSRLLMDAEWVIIPRAGPGPLFGLLPPTELQ